MHEQPCYQPPRWIITRSLGDKTMLYHADEGQVYYLEGTATRAWGWIAEHHPFAVNAWVAAMAEQFQGDRQVIEGDLIELLDDLVSHGLLEVAAEGACR